MNMRLLTHCCGDRYSGGKGIWVGASRSRSKTFEGQRIYIKGDLESDAEVGGLQKMV